MRRAWGVWGIKKAKRDLAVEPATAGLSRRRFLTFLGTGSAALVAGASGVLPQKALAQEDNGSSDDPSDDSPSGPSVGDVFFDPIEPSAEDEVILPEGFSYRIIRKWGDPVTGDGAYGYNNDYVAYFPIDALDGGEDSSDGLLWVNHEYTSPLFVSEYDDPEGQREKTKEEIQKEKASVGGSVFRVRKDGDSWGFVQSEEYNRRVDATTPMDLTGPGAGSDVLKGATEVIGTLANCGGGVTPWNTVLSCEENFQDYYGETSGEQPEGDGLAETYRWLDDGDGAHPPEHYGWVVEIDPFDKDSKPRKHTWLGRIRHENAAVRLSDGGRVVVYTGHDQEDQCIYKFVSSGTFREGDREANKRLLTDGMLYVADFANGRWVALDYKNNPIFERNGFAGQTDVLVRLPEAVKLTEEDDGPPIGTPLDRCEDIEVHPETGAVYASLTNNALHGNFYGQILRITENDDDPTAEGFAFEVFAAGGPNTGFASPDNLAFDGDNNLWVVNDISSSSLGDGIYESFRNNGVFFMPAGSEGAEVYQFASAPVEAELTGPFFTPDGKTLFLAVQHPGEETEDPDDPTSTWPDGDIPRPAVIAITGF